MTRLIIAIGTPCDMIMIIPCCQGQIQGSASASRVLVAIARTHRGAMMHANPYFSPARGFITTNLEFTGIFLDERNTDYIAGLRKMPVDS